jgi:hypothetical protein
MSVEENVTSRVLSTLQSLESDGQKRIRIAGIAVGVLVTIGMWIVHLSFPELFQLLLSGRREIKLLAALVLIPPFVAGFSAGHLIWPSPDGKASPEDGPMSGYFYRRSADTKWKIAIAAGLVAGANFLLMLITSDPGEL